LDATLADGYDDYDGEVREKKRKMIPKEAPEPCRVVERYG
jgi:hypothetical protein